MWLRTESPNNSRIPWTKKSMKTESELGLFDWFVCDEFEWETGVNT